MAQLENSSVSPTKMQICPGKIRTAVRRHSHQQPQVAPCPLPAGREASHPSPWGLHLLAVGSRGICGLWNQAHSPKGHQHPGQGLDRAGQADRSLPVGTEGPISQTASPARPRPPPPCTPHCTHIGPHNAAFGGHKDEADEDGRAQHAHGTHQRVSSLGPKAAPARGSCPRHHTQEARKAGDGPKDEAVGTKDGGVWADGKNNTGAEGWHFCPLSPATPLPTTLARPCPTCPWPHRVGCCMSLPSSARLGRGTGRAGSTCPGPLWRRTQPTWPGRRRRSCGWGRGQGSNTEWGQAPCSWPGSSLSSPTPSPGPEGL